MLTPSIIVLNNLFIYIYLLLGEPGLMVVQIKKDFEFDGYKGNKELSEKKYIRDVSCKGDVYFNSGDLLTQDEDYNVYFTDRIGDTFR
jgi:acyl-coenzyme A synthetase/AMP-(fatty) acid ligase